MTESTKTFTFAEAVETDLDQAHFLWAAKNRGKKSAEEAIATARQQTVLTITDQPGGRLLIYIEVYGKKPQSKVTTYNRYQRIPGNGYVLVYHRDM